MILLQDSSISWADKIQDNRFAAFAATCDLSPIPCCTDLNLGLDHGDALIPAPGDESADPRIATRTLPDEMLRCTTTSRATIHQNSAPISREQARQFVTDAYPLDAEESDLREM